MSFDRRRFGIALAWVAGASIVGWGWLELASQRRVSEKLATPEGRRALFEEAVATVGPKEGFQSRIALKDTVSRLIGEGVLDPRKFISLYDRPGGIPPAVRYLLKWPSPNPILLTAETATAYVNLLWPLGLANRMTTNEQSPINTVSLPSFASTAGWWLGEEANGAAYFNKIPIVALTADQEALVIRVAKTTFRPCCNNSTFYQDCNHGSALLGLLELGASQGLTEGDLYREALGFNSFWFPDTYVKTALYFRIFERTDWRDVDPRLVMGYDYSAIGPWRRNVEARIKTIPDLIPEPAVGANCGV
jgi:hypothetical protein